MPDAIDRREFLAAGAASLGAPPAAAPKILNHNPKMEYRRLGKTGLMVSAVCIGGHWKRVATVMPPGFKGEGYMDEDFKNIKDPTFLKNRAEVITRCIECGMNYVDACAPQEILAYSKVLEGRRDRMYFGFSWHTREPRFEEWRKVNRLVEGFERSLKEARLEYADVWRISLPMEAIPDLGVANMVEEATVGALEKAKQKGLARFTGVSSHNRTWLKYLVEHYPKQIEVILFPYTADSKVLPGDSLFDSIRKHDVGVFGIKPFAGNRLFAGDSSPASPTREEDDKRARLALRYVLENPAITAPIPGFATIHHVDNAARAVEERRREGRLSSRQRAELESAARGIWARLDKSHQWLRNWEYV